MSSNDVSDGPAKITHLHVAEPVRAHVAGSEKRWRNHGEHPLSTAYHKGQLIRGIMRDERGREKYCAAERYSAGDQFRRLWESCAATGRDSTDLNRISGGRGDPITITQASAITELGRIHAALTKQDREIIQHVCGEAWWPSEAVRYSCGPGYEHATVPRLNEALDNLIEAFSKAKRLAEFGDKR